MNERRNRHPRARGLTAIGVGALLLLYVAMAVSAAAGKSNTFDEIAHLTAGYSYWAFDDYRLQPANGNWPQRLAALPAVVRGLSFPAHDEAWRQSDVWAVGDEFFFGQGNDIDRALLEGRSMIAGIGAALGALVFAWARRMTSDEGGWIALGLFVWSPTMLAHGALTTSDMAAAFGFLAAMGAVWRLLHRVTPWSILLSVAACAWLALAKFSFPLLLPMVALMVVVRWWRGGGWLWSTGRSFRRVVIRRPGRMALAGAGVVAIHVLVVWLAIWASYGFRYSAFAGDATNAEMLTDWTELLTSADGQTTVTGRIVNLARETRILPEAYLYGFLHTLRFARSRESFMNGEVTTVGRWSFFPYAFLVKSTIPFLGLLALGASALVLGSRARRRLYRATPLLVLVGVYGAAALTSNLNIGHRHLLPIYPPLLVLCGGSAVWLRRRTRIAERGGRGRARGKLTSSTTVRRPWAVVAVSVLLAWHVVESARVRPDYLAYFNQLAGGPGHGYRHLVDSSLDWGQDLPALKAWLDQNVEKGPSPVPIYLSYFGTARPEHWGIAATTLPAFVDRRTSSSIEPLRPGVYAISATMLQGGYTLTGGRWTARDEADYQEVLRQVGAVLAGTSGADLSEDARDAAAPLFDRFEQLRFCRLLLFLRLQEPVAQPGHSILIYRLTSSDLQRALVDPVPG